MIDTYLPLINARLNNVKPLDITTHISGDIVHGLEEELVIGDLYEGRFHPSFPSDRVERATGARKLVDPRSASYLNMDLRVGRVMLNIKDKNSPQNLEAIAIIYGGESRKIKVNESKARLHFGKAILFVMLLDNGVVSAYYRAMGFSDAHVTSWHTGRRTDFGWPYPESDVDVRNMLEQATSHSGMTRETKAYKAYPHLVMLAVDTHRKAVSS